MVILGINRVSADPLEPLKSILVLGGGLRTADFGGLKSAKLAKIWKF